MVTSEDIILQTDTQSIKLRQKAEAISRLMHLGVPKKILRDFESLGRIWMATPAAGYAPIEDDMQKEIAAFETENDATVYLVTRMITLYGTLDSFVFVSHYEEEWEDEKINLDDGYLLTYTINRDHPECSEMGDIVIERTKNGGIRRIR